MFFSTLNRERSQLIVILGTDGSGKSTILSEIEHDLNEKAKNYKTYYFAPGFLTRYRSDGSGTPNTDPHKGKQYSAIFVFAKILLMLFEFNAGIRKARQTHDILIFDRFIHDLLVDPIRYRMGRVRWWMPVLLKLAPAPDLVIVISAPAEVVHQRKQEMPLEESERQIVAYKNIVTRFSRSLIIENTETIAKATDAALCAIYAYD